MLNENTLEDFLNYFFDSDVSNQEYFSKSNVENNFIIPPVPFELQEWIEQNKLENLWPILHKNEFNTLKVISAMDER